MTGAERVCATLAALGVDTVFGLPGSQNLDLFSALGASALRTVVATSETAASFMANGYARATGRPGILFTIPGPGFTFALSGIAEAFLDSVPLLYIVGAPARAPGRRFQLQSIDQASMAEPITKAVLSVEDAAQVESVVREAYTLSLRGEPGPILVQMAPQALSARSVTDSATESMRSATASVPIVDALVARLRESRRPLLYAGQGALGAGLALAALAEALRSPVVTTTSGRGVLAETHPWAIPSDLAPREAVTQLFAEADLVVALGVKFSHNGARGFRLELPAEKLVHVDAETPNIGANFPPSLGLVGDAATVVEALVSRLGAPSSTWTLQEVEAWRERLSSSDPKDDPRLKSLHPQAPVDFFDALSRELPTSAVVTVDSGQHQMLARRHMRVKGPRSLIVPTNFQSMGFGIPAAIGAKMGRPQSVVLALVGDGGFALSGMELLTAVREGIDLTVIVFNDGHFGLIREQQASAHGTTHGTRLRNPDFARFASAVGAKYVRVKGDVVPAVKGIIAAGQGVVLAEVVVRDSVHGRVSRLKDVLAARARRLARFGR